LRNRQEIRVTCLFPEGGESIQKILLRSFCFYLQRELESEGHRLPFRLGPDEMLLK